MKRVREMTVREILIRRVHDYGYKSLKGAARDMGLGDNELWMLINGATSWPRIDTRRAICQVLDIDAGVLDAACRRR